MDERVDTTLLASELRVVLGQLVRRLRVEYRFSLSQASVLSRLEREGTSSTSDLGVAERVRPQSMTQTVSDLEADELITRRPDPSDGRRTLIELSDQGREALAADRRKREGWLASTITNDLTDHEQQTLASALGLLQRLSDA